MNPWPFVIAAYVLTALATVGLLGLSALAMHRAEAAADTARPR